MDFVLISLTILQARINRCTCLYFELIMVHAIGYGYVRTYYVLSELIISTSSMPIMNHLGAISLTIEESYINQYRL